MVVRNPQSGVAGFADIPEGLRVYDADDGGPGVLETLFTRPWAIASRIAAAHNSVLHDPRVADCVPYAASKGAVAAFTRDLARKWCRYNIHVNAIAPGYFGTKMSRYLIEHRRDAVMNSVPMGRLCEPDEIKGVVVFLASAAADYITGQILAVDGGVLA